MPYAAPKLCSAPGCRRLNCREHQRRREYDRERGGSTQRGYGIMHQRARTDVLIADPYCKICEREGRKSLAVIVDHIIPLSRGGSQDRSNKQGVCNSCNTKKGSKIEGELGWCVSFAPR